MKNYTVIYVHPEDDDAREVDFVIYNAVDAQVAADRFMEANPELLVVRVEERVPEGDIV